MKQNMGTVDRLLRAFVAAPTLILVGLFFGWSVLGVAAFVVAGVMLATSATGFCPGYVPFGVSTEGGISIHGRVRFGGRARVVAQQ